MKAYWSGHLSGEPADAVLAHLAGCRGCQTAVEAFDTGTSEAIAILPLLRFERFDRPPSRRWWLRREHVAYAVLLALVAAVGTASGYAVLRLGEPRPIAPRPVEPPPPGPAAGWVEGFAPGAVDRWAVRGPVPEFGCGSVVVRGSPDHHQATTLRRQVVPASPGLWRLRVTARQRGAVPLGGAARSSLSVGVRAGAGDQVLLRDLNRWNGSHDPQGTAGGELRFVVNHRTPAATPWLEFTVPEGIPSFDVWLTATGRSADYLIHRVEVEPVPPAG